MRLKVRASMQHSVRRPLRSQPHYFLPQNLSAEHKSSNTDPVLARLASDNPQASSIELATHALQRMTHAVTSANIDTNNYHITSDDRGASRHSA